MSRQPSQFTQQPPAPGVQNTGKLKRYIIATVTPDGSIYAPSLTQGTLLLNPENIEDTKSSNWVANPIPGQSDPIYQWVSGGPRLLSFDALVTKDTAEFLNPKDDPLAGLIDNAVNAVGSIASNFLGINLPAIGDIFSSLNSQDAEGNQLSIEPQLNYYRSLMYPTYSENGRLVTSPPIIAILNGGSISTSNTAPGITTISENTDLWVLLELKISITKQLPNLTPMEAIVSFRFNQYTVKSFGKDHFSQDQQSTPSQGNSITQTLSGYLA